MIEFFAAGVPSTKGSAKAWVRGGRAIITNDAGQKAKAWAAIVSAAALDAMAGAPPMEGPVDVIVTFYMPRPQSHYTKAGLRPNAPRWSFKKPDIDKLERCSLDALTGIVFHDDAQIARLVAEKRYTNGSAGAAFIVDTFEERQARSPRGGGLEITPAALKTAFEGFQEKWASEFTIKQPSSRGDGDCG